MTPRLLPRLLLLIGFVVGTFGLWLGCSDDGAGDQAPSDDISGGGGDAALSDRQQGLNLPELPRLTPCPEGWFEVAPESDAEPAVCYPWPDGVAVACDTPDQAHFTGQPACTRIGTACPDGDWAAELPTDGDVHFVRAGEVGGNGTRSSPFGTVAAALEVASEGDVIALAKGHYDEAIALPSGVTLWGACVAETLVAPSTLAEERGGAAIAAAGEGVVVRNLQISGERMGLQAPPGTAIRLESVLIDGVREAGLDASGGSVTAYELVVRDPRPSAEREVAFAPAIRQFADTGTVTVERAVLEGSQAMAVVSFGGGMQLDQVAIPEVVSAAGNEGVPLGIGIFALAGEVTVSSSIVQCTEFYGISGGEDGVDLAIEDVVLRGAPPGGDCAHGGGLILGTQDGTSRLTVSRTLIEDLESIAVFINQGVDATLTDVVIRDLDSGSTPDMGAALAAENESTVTLTRVLIERAEGAAMFLLSGADVEGSDVTIRDTREFLCGDEPCPRGEFDGPGDNDFFPTYGSAVIVVDAGKATFQRFDVSDNALCGFQLVDQFGDPESVATHVEVDLSDGLVSENVVGINLQVDDYDLTRLERGVLFLGNQRNIDSAELPVPDPTQFFPR